MILANPDFEKIRAEGFNRYHYKPVQKTLTAYKERADVADLWLKGSKDRCFIPQLHGREHVQWWRWLKTLRQGSKEALEAFQYSMCGVPLAASKEGISFYGPIYLHPSVLEDAGVDIEDMVVEGTELFEQLFGFRSISTVAPNVTWSEENERIWAACGIRFIQGGPTQMAPSPKGSRRRRHYLGEQNRFGQRYIIRNCTFEPIREPGVQVWRRCLKEIELAFAMNKPAVICSHRMNFIGWIDPENRRRNLDQLRLLFEAICMKYKKVYFLSTPELGLMMEYCLKRVEDLEFGHLTPSSPCISSHQKKRNKS
jgi:hypothetical protein